MSDDVARAFREAAAWSADHHPVLPTYATGYHAALDAIALAILSVDLADVTKELLAELAAHFTVLPVTDRFNAPDLSVGEHPRVLGDLLRVELRNDGAELWGIVALKEAFLRQLVGGELRPDERVADLLRRAATLRLAVSFMKSSAAVAHARLREVVLENVPAIPAMAHLEA